MIRLRNLEGQFIWHGVMVEGTATVSAIESLIHAPVADGIILARYTFPFDVEVAGFAVVIVVAGIKSDETHLNYLVMKLGAAEGAADPTITHGNGTELTARVAVRDSTPAVDIIPAVNTQIAAYQAARRNVPAGTDILLVYNETGTVGGTRATFRLRGAEFNKMPSPNNKLGL